MHLFTLSYYSDLIPGMIIAQNIHQPAVFIREGRTDERICSGDLIVRFLDTLEETYTLYSSSIMDIVCLGALTEAQSVLLQIEAWDALASQTHPILDEARALSLKLGHWKPDAVRPTRIKKQPSYHPSQDYLQLTQNLAQVSAGFGLPPLNNCSTTAQPSQTHP